MEKLIIVGDDLAQKISSAIDAKFVAVEEKIFPDGEIKPRLKISKEFKTKTAVLVLRKKEKEDINNYLAKFLLLGRKLKDCSKKVIGVMPYLPYARQDKVFWPGEPFSAGYWAEFLEKIFDIFITVNMHEHRRKINQIFSIPAYNLSIFQGVAEYMSNQLSQAEKNKMTLIGPDKEAEHFVDDFRKGLALDFLILKKERSVRTGKVSFDLPKVDLGGREALIVDDVASSAKTLIKAAELIKRKGASAISFVVCHGLFVEGAFNSLKKMRPRRFIVSNTIINSAANYDVTPLIVNFFKNNRQLIND